MLIYQTSFKTVCVHTNDLTAHGFRVAVDKVPGGISVCLSPSESGSDLRVINADGEVGLLVVGDCGGDSDAADVAE